MTYARVQLHLEDIERRLDRVARAIDALEELGAELSGLHKAVIDLRSEIAELQEV